MTADTKLGRGTRLPPDPGMEDFAKDIHGDNSLQGNDQTAVRNQRLAQPGVKHEAEGVVESFEKLDDDRKA